MMRPFLLFTSALMLVGCNSRNPDVAVATPSPTAPPKNGHSELVADTTASNYSERTKKLMAASEKGQISLLFELLQQQANVNDKDDEGNTALHRAAAAGQRSAVIALLVKGADLSEQDSQGRTAAMRAAEQGHADVVKLLFSPSDVLNQAGDVLKAVSADAAAALAGDAKNAFTNRLYSSVGGSEEVVDKLGQNVLMKAAANGHVECMRPFYSTGRTNLNHLDRNGQSAITLAAKGGHAAVIRELVNEPGGGDGSRRLRLATLLKPDNSGKTPEQWAAEGKHTDAAAAVRFGILITAAKENQSEVVRKHWEDTHPIEEIMIAAAEFGANDVIKEIMNQTKERNREAKLKLMGANLPTSSRSGTTLHFAIMNDHVATIELLTDLAWWGDKAALADFLGRRGFNNITPLEWANWSGFGTNAKPKSAAAIQKALEKAK